jgi:hypothetical protein
VKIFDFDKKEQKIKEESSFIAHLDPVKNITYCGPKGIFFTACRVVLYFNAIGRNSKSLGRFKKSWGLLK